MLISPVPEIEALHMTKVTCRPTCCEKMVIVDGMIIVRLNGNRWWCNWESFHKYALLPDKWDGRVEALLQGLMRLGMITKDAYTRHMAVATDASRFRELCDDQKTLERLAKQYHFAVPRIIPVTGQVTCG